MKNSLTLLTTFLLYSISNLSAVDLSFAGIFTDHTVLQREASTPIWGWADPNEQVTVAFAEQSKSVTADASGKWMVTLDPMPASAKGRDLVVQSSINVPSISRRLDNGRIYVINLFNVRK